MCQPLWTKERAISETCEVVFEETLVFDIQVCNIPRNAKLCFVIYEDAKSTKGSRTRKTKEQSKVRVIPQQLKNNEVILTEHILGNCQSNCLGEYNNF